MGACGKGFANCRWVTSSSIYTRVQLLPDPRCLEFLWMERASLRRVGLIQLNFQEFCSRTVMEEVNFGFICFF